MITELCSEERTRGGGVLWESGEESRGTNFLPTLPSIQKPIDLFDHFWSHPVLIQSHVVLNWSHKRSDLFKDHLIVTWTSSNHQKE